VLRVALAAFALAALLLAGAVDGGGRRRPEPPPPAAIDVGQPVLSAPMPTPPPSAAPVSEPMVEKVEAVQPEVARFGDLGDWRRDEPASGGVGTAAETIEPAEADEETDHSGPGDGTSRHGDHSGRGDGTSGQGDHNGPGDGSSGDANRSGSNHGPG
jgi:hypothetical protein